MLKQENRMNVWYWKLFSTLQALALPVVVCLNQ